ncbi:MAG: AAA family ATPase [Vicinamibacteria bacterium]
MHLSRIVLTGFRSFAHLQADFQPGLNVLVGRNNTGKTNLLHGIRAALGPAASRGDAFWLDRDDFHVPGPGKPPLDEFSITLTFSDLSASQRSQFFEIVEFDLQNVATSTATLRMKVTWSATRRQAIVSRTGGSGNVDSPELPQGLLASLPVTFLPALRDAEAALAPGQRSRLATMLRDLADRRERSGKADRDEILKIFHAANRAVEQQSLVRDTRDSLVKTTRDLAGTDHLPTTIAASDQDFERILRTLRVQMDGAALEGLDANGLGYNNLLYMAVVLEHLKSPEPDSSPLLLVEEPEAHLHPQLTTLLAHYLAETTPGNNTPQTFVTTHSPTMAASVQPTQIHVLYTNDIGVTECRGLAQAGMADGERRALQRMMDLTRATLYFAKGALLVEGISEALLLPVLAQRLDPPRDLRAEHISVVPIGGVAFETFKKLLGSGVLDIPVAIVTDADPPVTNRDQGWKSHSPEVDGTRFKLCDRTERLLTSFAHSKSVRVFHSRVTLEFDLAEAHVDNANTMAEAWTRCFQGTPDTFNHGVVAAAGEDASARALAAWRGICRANATAGKAAFAHHLADYLLERDSADMQPAFVVPAYIREAIEFVYGALHPSGGSGQPAPPSPEPPPLDPGAAGGKG